MNVTTLLLAPMISLLSSPLLAAADSIESLNDEFDAAQSAFYEARSSGAPGSAGESPAVVAFMPRYRAYAAEHVGRPEAVPALIWVASNSSKLPASDQEEALSEAMERLIADHADSASLADVKALQFLVHQVPLDDMVRLYEASLAGDSRDGGDALEQAGDLGLGFRHRLQAAAVERLGVGEPAGELVGLRAGDRVAQRPPGVHAASLDA